MKNRKPAVRTKSTLGQPCTGLDVAVSTRTIHSSSARSKTSR
jgi:hypothetical protein